MSGSLVPDQIAVATAVAAYGIHADARRWEQLIALFAPDVLVDYTALQGGEPARIAAVDLVAGWRAFLPGFSATHHLIGPPLTTIEGDRAEAEAQFTATHLITDAGLEAGLDRWTVAGRYEFGFVRLAGEWRIDQVRLVLGWQGGNMELPKLAGQRGSGAT